MQAMAGKKSKSSAVTLVIGGGIAGTTVANRLSRAGGQVHLIEKQPEIGGRAREMGCKATDVCMRCNVCVADEIFRNVRASAEIKLHTSTELLELCAGDNGTRYKATIGGNGAKPELIGVDSVVIATGYEPYDPRENGSYRFGAIPNVITGADAERQLSTSHKITRPSDGRVPARTAFIQCVGSRTEEIDRRPEDTDYCSTVCCSYALRMGQLIKHQAADSDITVFYMDIQKFGKGFDRLYADCKGKMQFIRSRPYELRAGAGGAVRVKYAATGGADTKVCVEDYDLVVLSVGIRPGADTWDLAAKLGVAVDEQGFFGLKGAAGLPDLQRAGIYVVGAAEAPKDIAGSIAQAEAVSAMIIGGGVSRVGSDGRIAGGVVVVGGGVAGMQAAVTLAELDHDVTLIHDAERLGGVAAAMPELCGHVGRDAADAEARTEAFVANMADGIAGNKGITVRAKTTLIYVDGDPGALQVKVGSDGKVDCLEAGALVLATGSGEVSVAEGSRPPIVDVRGLVKLAREGDPGQRIAVILDSTCEQGRSVWVQVLSAAEVLAKRGCRIKIYCNNARVAATGLESLYRRARECGVAVVKSDKKARISRRGKRVVIASKDLVADTDVSEEFDLVVMGDLKPGSDAGSSAVPRLKGGPDGALQYDNVWLTPALTNRPGIFVVGGARGNSEYRDALVDGLAVAGEAHALLTGDDVKARDDVATVDAEKCVLCLTCVRVCPHGAISIDYEESAAAPSAVSCRRCGICASECPAKAITLPGYTDEDIAGKIGTGPGVTVFACENSAIPASEAAGAKLGKNVKIVEVPCAGKVDPATVLSALESGAEKVLVIGCHPESCQYMSGSGRAEKRVGRVAAMLEAAGYDASRVSFCGLSAVEPGRFMEYVKGNG